MAWTLLEIFFQKALCGDGSFGAKPTRALTFISLLKVMATEALVGIGYINIINANALAGIEKHAWAKASNIQGV